MYRYSNGQISLADFKQPVGMNLKESNRWVKKAQTIPWPEIEKRCVALFTNRKGNVAKPLRLALCALISGLVTILMAFYANMPFALSTGMGTNFLLGAMIQSGTMSFGSAMVITLISGVIFVALTILGLRDIIVRMIPKNIKTAISASIGFFIAYLGFSNTGIGSFNGGIGMGDFTQPSVLLAVLGLAIIGVLTAYNVKGAILIGIAVITVLGIPLSLIHI